MVRAALVFIVVLLAACSSLGRLQTPSYAIRLEKIEFPLQTLQRLAVSVLPMGLANSSSNGREFTSRPFIRDLGTYKAAGDARIRYWARVSVLGDQRPYAMEVFVTREDRVLNGNDFIYEENGHDTRLAKEIAASLRTQLSKRREDLNIIDDFRVF